MGAAGARKITGGDGQMAGRLPQIRAAPDGRKLGTIPVQDVHVRLVGLVVAARESQARAAVAEKVTRLRPAAAPARGTGHGGELPETRRRAPEPRTRRPMRTTQSLRRRPSDGTTPATSAAPPGRGIHLPNTHHPSSHFSTETAGSCRRVSFRPPGFSRIQRGLTIAGATRARAFPAPG